ncbi:MAG: MipA/OmpV family protein [Burkholderiales bacterium]|nr:MipA/OmpV family protein [Burkholderiales bacterium]
MLASAALGREEPLWEAGIGVAGLHFPDYRGSSHSRNYALPAPYLVYRGDFLKADRYGLRARFFRSDRLDINLSLGASLPVGSDDNPARIGMPDLRPSLEIGPSVAATLWRAGDARMKLDARIPLRMAMTIESRPRFIGGQVYPHLNLDIHDPAGFSGWNLGLAAGPVFTDGRYNRYFYEVAPQYATLARPAYSPGGGYAGTQFLMALSKRFPRFWVGGFARYDTLRSAVFESSPLVTSKRYIAGGIGVSWIFGESSRRVEVQPFGDERK